MTRNRWSLLLSCVSMFLFVPGVLQPIFSIDISGKVETQIGGIDVKVLSQESSIIETVQQLSDDGRVLVAILILLFSVLVPLLKFALILVAHFMSEKPFAKSCQKLALGIGKWSMADVFVVAIFLAFLSTHQEANIQSETLQFMGMKIPVRFQLDILSGLGTGFYYFLAYCIISLAGFQLYKFPTKNSGSSHA